MFYILFLVGRIINDQRKDEKEEDELEELTEEEIQELITALESYNEVSLLYAKFVLKQIYHMITLGNGS